MGASMQAKGGRRPTACPAPITIDLFTIDLSSEPFAELPTDRRTID